MKLEQASFCLAGVIQFMSTKAFSTFFVSHTGPDITLSSDSGPSPWLIRSCNGGQE